MHPIVRHQKEKEARRVAEMTRGEARAAMTERARGSAREKETSGRVHCGKVGHVPANCWTLHPEQLPWKRTAMVDEDEGEVERDIGGLTTTALAVGGFPHGYEKPPGLRSTAVNRFAPLACDDDEGWPIGMLDIDGGERPIGEVAKVVMPKDMLPCQVAVEGVAKKSGVKYVTANGARVDNYGEKNVRFRGEGIKGTNSITFQVTDVGKPLEAVSKILDKGNFVVFSRSQGGSYIVNDVSGERIPSKEEKGTFVLDVEFLQERTQSNLDFARQGR